MRERAFAKAAAMTRRPFKARSADGPMMFAALEMHYPRDRRITEDPYAKAMLSPGVRLTVRAMRWRWPRAFLGRTLDRQLPGLWGGMVARKRYADGAVADALGAGIRQFVVLGAGFDTRAFRLIAPAGAEAFEVDLPANVARKRRILRRIFGRMPERVTLVAADLKTDDLAASLANHGFRPDRPTMFVVEAVTQYLTDDAAGRLFAFLGEAPASSRLTFTYVEKGFLDGSDLRDWESAYREWVEKDRVWRWGLEPAAVGEVLRRHGWTELEQVGAEEYRARYFLPARRDLTAMDIERFVLAEKTANRSMNRQPTPDDAVAADDSVVAG